MSNYIFVFINDYLYWTITFIKLRFNIGSNFDGAEALRCYRRMFFSGFGPARCSSDGTPPGNKKALANLLPLTII